MIRIKVRWKRNENRPAALSVDLQHCVYVTAKHMLYMCLAVLKMVRAVISPVKWISPCTVRKTPCSRPSVCHWCSAPLTLTRNLLQASKYWSIPSELVQWKRNLAVHYGDPWFDNGFVDYLTTRCHKDYCSESIFLWWFAGDVEGTGSDVGPAGWAKLP